MAFLAFRCLKPHMILKPYKVTAGSIPTKMVPTRRSALALAEALPPTNLSVILSPPFTPSSLATR
ncbi:MAG: hypothetical protein RBJ76_20735 [Stenomitos frigidus ULC029]